ncbi:unnamed protein product, partial [Amoebophrya sp. A25]|eukprot:GSA25T00007274001.1
MGGPAPTVRAVRGDTKNPMLKWEMQNSVGRRTFGTGFGQYCQDDMSFGIISKAKVVNGGSSPTSNNTKNSATTGGASPTSIKSRLMDELCSSTLPARPNALPWKIWKPISQDTPRKAQAYVDAQSPKTGLTHILEGRPVKISLAREAGRGASTTEATAPTSDNNKFEPLSNMPSPLIDEQFMAIHEELASRDRGHNSRASTLAKNMPGTNASAGTLVPAPKIQRTDSASSSASTAASANVVAASTPPGELQGQRHLATSNSVFEIFLSGDHSDHRTGGAQSRPRPGTYIAAPMLHLRDHGIPKYEEGKGSSALIPKDPIPPTAEGSPEMLSRNQSLYECLMHQQKSVDEHSGGDVLHQHSTATSTIFRNNTSVTRSLSPQGLQYQLSRGDSRGRSRGRSTRAFSADPRKRSLSPLLTRIEEYYRFAIGTSYRQEDISSLPR